MQARKKKNLRVVCVCGQRMKVTRDMYGKAAKCVACHRKWFVPGEDELPADTTVIQLQDHPELLRKTGVFVRSTGEEDENEGGEVRAVIPAFPGEDEDREIPREEARSGKGAAPGLEAVSPMQRPGEEEGVRAEDLDEPSGKVAASIRAKKKRPFDTWEPLRLLCNYQKAFDQLEQRGLEGEEPGVTREVLTAYGNSLQQVWDKLRTTLQQAHESAQRQLTSIESEIDRLTVALRVGEVDLPHFISTAAALRQSRESVARLDHNLLAWRQVDDPLFAGGELEVDLDSFDPDCFMLDLPTATPPIGAPPLPMLYSNELRASMQARATAEQRRAEWKRIAESRSGEDASAAGGLAAASAELGQIRAKIAFLRQRMQQLLADCAHDLDSFHKYRRDVLERDRKNQLKRGVKEALLLAIEKAESDLVRIEAYLRQTLHANVSTEVPQPTATLLERLQPRRAPRRMLPALGAYSAALAVLLPVLLFLSWRETGEIHRSILLPALVLLAQPASLLFQNLWLRVVAAVFLWIMLCAMLVAALLSMAQYVPLHAGRHILPFLDSPGVFLVLGFCLCGLAAGIILAEYHRLGLKKAMPLLLGCILISGVVPAATYAWAQREVSVAPYTPPASYKDPQNSVPPPVAIDPQREEALPDTETPQPDADKTAETVQDTDDTPVENPPDSESVDDNQVPVEEGEASSDPAIPMSDNLRVVFSLGGVVHGQGVSPMFRASLLFPDGTEKKLTLRLGETISGDWTASEYNVEDKKLTITNGKKLLLLNPGEKVEIDTASTMEPEAPENGRAETVP